MENPQLAHALLLIQLSFDMVKAEDIKNLTENANPRTAPARRQNNPVHVTGNDQGPCAPVHYSELEKSITKISKKLVHKSESGFKNPIQKSQKN